MMNFRTRFSFLQIKMHYYVTDIKYHLTQPCIYLMFTESVYFLLQLRFLRHKRMFQGPHVLKLAGIKATYERTDRQTDF